MTTTATQRKLLKPWRRHRLLHRDMDAGEQTPAILSPARDRRLPPPDEEGKGSLKDLREKLLGHLRHAADNLKLEMATKVAVGEADKSWNLRLRTTSKRTMRLRSERSEKRKKKRRKFSIALSPEEIEEDVFALTGSRPRRRPKKRPRNVQWQLDALFPAVWLPEITPELYKVAE